MNAGVVSTKRRSESSVALACPEALSLLRIPVCSWDDRLWLHPTMRRLKEAIDGVILEPSSTEVLVGGSGPDATRRGDKIPMLEIRDAEAADVLRRHGEDGFESRWGEGLGWRRHGRCGHRDQCTPRSADRSLGPTYKRP